MSSSDHELSTGAAEAPQSRRQLLVAGGAALVASIVAMLGLSERVDAKNGDAVRAGQKTTATKTTALESKKGPALQVKVSAASPAVRGSASSPKGIGVQGAATASKGSPIGVQGFSSSSEAIAGQFVADSGGTALEARSAKKQGVALRTEGKLQFTKRSGTSSASGGMEFVIPVAGGLTEESIVLATLQDHHPGVHVESASVLDLEDPRIVVRLNQALAEQATVGWIVLD